MAVIRINFAFRLDVKVILLAMLDPLNDIAKVFPNILRQMPGRPPTVNGYCQLTISYMRWGKSNPLG